jgi:hypothetical protein
LNRDARIANDVESTMNPEVAALGKPNFRHF